MVIKKNRLAKIVISGLFISYIFVQIFSNLPHSTIKNYITPLSDFIWTMRISPRYGEFYATKPTSYSSLYLELRSNTSLKRLALLEHRISPTESPRIFIYEKIYQSLMNRNQDDIFAMYMKDQLVRNSCKENPTLISVSLSASSIRYSDQKIIAQNTFGPFNCQSL